MRSGGVQCFTAALGEEIHVKTQFVMVVTVRLSSPGVQCLCQGLSRVFVYTQTLTWSWLILEGQMVKREFFKMRLLKCIQSCNIKSLFLVSLVTDQAHLHYVEADLL